MWQPKVNLINNLVDHLFLPKVFLSVTTFFTDYSSKHTKKNRGEWLFMTFRSVLPNSHDYYNVTCQSALYFLQIWVAVTPNCSLSFPLPFLKHFLIFHCQVKSNILELMSSMARFLFSFLNNKSMFHDTHLARHDAWSVTTLLPAHINVTFIFPDLLQLSRLICTTHCSLMMFGYQSYLIDMQGSFKYLLL